MNEQQIDFKFVTQPSTEDVRDVYHSDTTTAAMPPEQFEIKYDHPHYNQKAIGICVGADMCDMLQQIFGMEFDMQFFYNGMKSKIDGDWNEGSSMRTGLDFAYKYGARPLPAGERNNVDMSYENYIKRIYTQADWDEAAKYKISGYARVGLDPISFALALSQSQAGVLTRMAVGDNFYRPSWRKEDLEPLRAPNPVSGGHSIKSVKYAGVDQNQIRKDRNTWGDVNNPIYAGDIGWCDNGDIEMVYETQAPYITEAWVILPQHPSATYTHRFNTLMLYGDKSAEVTALQRVLQKYQDPKQLITGFYGDMTAKNVMAFQTAQNLASPATIKQLAGKRVGTATMAGLNKVQGL